MVGAIVSNRLNQLVKFFVTQTFGAEKMLRHAFRHFWFASRGDCRSHDNLRVKIAALLSHCPI